MNQVHSNIDLLLARLFLIPLPSFLILKRIIPNYYKLYTSFSLIFLFAGVILLLVFLFASVLIVSALSSFLIISKPLPLELIINLLLLFPCLAFCHIIFCKLAFTPSDLVTLYRRNVYKYNKLKETSLSPSFQKISKPFYASLDLLEDTNSLHVFLIKLDTLNTLFITCINELTNNPGRFNRRQPYLMLDQFFHTFYKDITNESEHQILSEIRSILPPSISDNKSEVGFSI
jgi:hypothetical protein